MTIDALTGEARGEWFDALPQAVILHENLRVTRLNAAAARLWGVPDERARGRRLIEVVRRHTLETLAERGGELEIEAGGRALKCQAVRGALIVEDVTDSRRREAELREAAAVLSHEFRTPVTVIKGVLEALQYDVPPDLARSFLAQGLAEVERLARLVDDLALGVKPARARKVSLSEVLSRAERLLGGELESAGVRLSRGDDVTVRADPDKLLQVLLNLIENGIRHGPRPGTVRVEARQDGGFAEIAVLDGGAPLEGGHSIWQAHTRGENVRGEGSGMGLYIVRSIVEGWGGQAWHERRGAGNAFCFTVPGT